MTQDWAIPQTTGDWVSRTERRLVSLERRDGAVSQITSVIGPAQNKRAMVINDWNDPLVANNGYFWSRPGALHAPDGARVWTGSVVARSDNSGMQQVWNTDDLDDVRYYMRTFIDDGTGQGRTFSEWRNFATPTGFIELPDLGDTIDDLLADMAADIDSAAQALLFFEQDAEPVPGVSGVPAEIPVGSVWVDTDDNRHTYSWDGDEWISIESTLFGDIATQLATMQDEIEAAATAASEAMDFAETLNKVYRQNAAPTNPDPDGRALVYGDTWFDQNDDNRMYNWNGSAWVELGIATEVYVNDATDVVLNFAVTLNKTYRQSSAPTNPDAGGRTLVAQDTWFDTSTSLNEMKRWSGSAWVSADIGLTDADLATPTVTGGLIQTSATPLVGIKMASGGIIAYNGAGSPTFFIDAATGGIATIGTLAAGGTIDGAIVTGGTIQSEATAGRGVKINSGGLILYAPSPAAAGLALITLNATTGSILLSGNITGAGSITGPLFQTDAAANTGIKISSAGLVGYNGTIAKFTLDATTGILALAGGVLTAGTIDGAVVTGGTIQTEATAARGIKFNSSGMTVYDGSGGSVMTVVAATGAVTINGALAAISLTGVTVTGGILQTTVTASRGIKITSTGMIGYADGSGADPAGTTVFSLLATTGVLTLAGGVLTGGSLTGGIVTGGTLQSEATAARGIKINSAGMIAYNSSGVARFTIDATTGDVALAGNMTGGGTITGPIFQTSSSGKRIVIDGPGDIFNMYTGVALETAPGTIDPDILGGVQPSVKITSGTTSGANGAEASSLRVTTGPVNNSSIALDTAKVYVNASLTSFQGGAGAIEVQGLATLNAGLTLTGSFAGQGNAHVGYRSTAAAQTIATATLTTMNLAGTTDHDVGGGFSKSSDIVTITAGGIYQLHAFCPFNTNTGNCRNLLRIETWGPGVTDLGPGLMTIIGAAEDIGTVVQSNWMNVYAQRAFSSGAKVRCVLYQNQGSNATTSGNLAPHQLNIRRVS